LPDDGTALRGFFIVEGNTGLAEDIVARTNHPQTLTLNPRARRTRGGIKVSAAGTAFSATDASPLARPVKHPQGCELKTVAVLRQLWWLKTWRR